MPGYTYVAVDQKGKEKRGRDGRGEPRCGFPAAKKRRALSC